MLMVLPGCGPALAARSVPVVNEPTIAPTPKLPARVVPKPSASSSDLDQAIVDALRSDYATAEPVQARTGAEDPAPLPALVRAPMSLEPKMATEADSSARLPPETIQRVVRTSSGRFRACYQRALVRDPKATGQIVTLFVIGAEGLVDLAQEEEATLADRPARECVQRAFFDLHFPKPPGGKSITVLYPMRFGIGSRGPTGLPTARRVAEPPPPGFAERMRSGIRVEPDPPVMPFRDRDAPPPPSPCTPGDPMCAEL